MDRNTGGLEVREVREERGQRMRAVDLVGDKNET